MVYKMETELEFDVKLTFVGNKSDLIKAVRDFLKRKNTQGNRWKLKPESARKIGV